MTRQGKGRKREGKEDDSGITNLKKIKTNRKTPNRRADEGLGVSRRPFRKNKTTVTTE